MEERNTVNITEMGRTGAAAVLPLLAQAAEAG
jgi:hypothetical protein